MFSLWCQVRLAGSVMMLIGAYTRNFSLMLVGFSIVFVGVVNGLYLVERKVEALEKEKGNDEK